MCVYIYNEYILHGIMQKTLSVLCHPGENKNCFPSSLQVVVVNGKPACAKAQILKSSAEWRSPPVTCNMISDDTEELRARAGTPQKREYQTRSAVYRDESKLRGFINTSFSISSTSA